MRTSMFRRGRSGRLGWAATALAALFLVATLAGVLHHHLSGDSEDGCALCALVHAAVVTPPGIAIDSDPLRDHETVVTTAPAPPAPVDRYTTAPRGPPAS